MLSHRTSVNIRPEYSNIIGHMCYAASKLWNACNYERRRYKELGLEKYPDWYYQKKAHKGDLWYRQLPSQTAQETCKQLRIYTPEDGKCDLIVIYEVKEPELESYTSQCSPFSPEISKRYAKASNRKERGMYITDGVRYNADAVGAFNILRKYLSVSGKQKELSVTGLKNPEIIKVAV